MNFLSHWIHLISQCVTTTSFKVQVNGNLAEPFLPSVGLRQGDPISPYLFILCMNVLSSLMIKAQDEGSLKGIKVSRRALPINNLIYADDVFLFFKANLESCEAFVLDLESCKASKFKMVDMFNKYLGSFMDEGTRSRKIFKDIQEKLPTKVSSWKSKLISQARRIVLIKSVLSSVPMYHLSYFALTDKEAKKCDSVLANLFQGNHVTGNSPHMIAWNKICQPKHRGGLGIRKFKDFNNAL